MSLFDRIPAAFRLSRFRRDAGRDARREVEDEIDFYIDMRARELVAGGMDHDTANAVARARFGDRDRIEYETLRTRRSEGGMGEMMRGTFREVRQAVRSLTRRPGFALTILVTLALGIGGSTTMFTVVNSVLFRPLPYPSPDRLVVVHETNSRRSDRNLAPLNFLDARAGAETLEHFSAYRVLPMNLLGEGEPERLVAGTVSSNFFSTFGVPPELGRTFTMAVAQPGDARAIVLSNDLWVRRFGSDPDVVGTRVRLDQETVEIAGVMPPAFRFPEDADFWIKALGDVPGGGPGGPLDHLQMRDAWYFDGVARLRPDAPIAVAQAEMDGIASRIREVDPENNAETGFALVPLLSATVASARTSLLLLFAAVGLVLLIACTNVANLVLVRSAGRATELGVRVALGAGRGGLIRHLLTESAVLGAGGAVLGGGLAMLGSGLIRNAASQWLPRAGEVTLDGWALAFTAGVAGVTLLLVGLLPTLSSSHADPARSLVSRGTGGQTRGSRRLRNVLVIGETALAIVLVLTAGLTLKSVVGLSRIDLGFETDGLATMPFMVPGAQALEEAEWRSIYRSVLERVEEVGGIESATLATRGPVSTGWQAGLRVEGREYDSNNPPIVGWQVVSENYFSGIGIPILEGRGFVPTDGSGDVEVAVINQAMAQSIWQGESPLGQRINTGLDGSGLWVTVVGVAGNTRNRGPMSPVVPAYFRPLGQSGTFGGDGMMLSVRTMGDPAPRVPDIQRAAWSVEPSLPFYRILVEDDIAAGFTARPRFILGLLGVFAAIALVLGGVGIHGVTAFSVEQRTRELGIRVALGAERRAVLAMVLRQSFLLVGAGLALGVVGTLALSRVLQGLLHEVSPTDGATYAAVVVLFILVAVVSTAIPAHRAARIDPVTAMRGETG